MRAVLRSTMAAVAAAAAMMAAGPSQAALFEDDEARRAILELRQRVEAQRQSQLSQAEEQRRATEENAQLRRAMLDLHFYRKHGAGASYGQRGS